MRALASPTFAFFFAFLLFTQTFAVEPVVDCTKLARIALAKKVEIPTEHKSAIDYKYNNFRKSYSDTKFDIRNSTQSGYELAKRWNAGESHAKTLGELGFQLGGPGNQFFVPPADLETLFTNSNQIIERLIKDGLLKSEDAIYPALTFTRYNAAKKIEYSFVRPGIDEFPSASNGWHIAHDTEAEMPGEIWAQALVDGKNPLAISMLDHDLGHLTDMLDSPLIMGAIKKTYSRFLELRKKASHSLTPNIKIFSWRDHRDKIEAVKNYSWRRIEEEKPSVLPKTAFERLDIRALNSVEFVSLPSPDKTEAVQSMMPQFYKGPVKTTQQNKKFLADLPFDQRKQHFETVSKTAESVLERHGGAARDSYNLTRHSVAEHGSFRSIAFGLAKGPQAPVPLPAVRDGMHNTLHALVNEVQLLFDLRYGSNGIRRIKEGTSPFSAQTQLPSMIKEIVGNMSDAQIKAQLDLLLIDRVARLEGGIYTALDQNVKIEDIVNEAVMDRSPSTKSYRFFRSFAQPGSITYEAFVGQ